MAKTIRDEDIRLSIIVNGNQAQKEIYELDQANRKLIESNQDIKKEMLSLSKQGKKQSDEYKNLTKSLNQNNAALEVNKLKIKELEGTVGIANLTLAQLRRRAKEVQIALVNMTPGSAQFKAYSAELAQLTARISELRGKATASGMSLGQVADKLNRYQTLIAGIIATLAGFYFSFQQFVDFQHKMADAQADVMKTTGLTKKEVDELTKSFNSFNTRTPRMELLKLAEEGGRLGIQGSENLRKYVNVANQLKVALGDDLSDTQIREVGKLTDVYKIGAESGRDFEQSMMSLGSAINEVAASGANQASFQVDYLKRQAGIAAQAKIGAANNIGYAATFDEIGQSVEVSATAMNKIWMDMFRDSSTYAKIAKMSVKDFNTLLQKDSNEAMKAFLRGLNGNNEGLSVMVNKLSDLDVGGVRGAQALSALAGNVEKLEQKQKIANQALIDNISLTNEYNVKNNNVAATLDKIQKKIQGWFTSDIIVKFFTKVISLLAELIGATEQIDEETEKWKANIIDFVKIIAVILSGFLSYRASIILATSLTNSYRAAVILTTLAEKAHALSLSVLNPLINLLRGGLFALQLTWIAVTKGTKAATVQMRAFSMATKMNPVGALITLLTVAASAWLLFKNRAKEATQELTKEQAASLVTININKSMAESIGKTVGEMKAKISSYIYVLQDENTSLELRKRKYNELIRIAPEFIGTVDKEYRANEKLMVQYDLLVKKLTAVARAKAWKSIIEAAAEKEAKAMEKLLIAEEKAVEERAANRKKMSVKQAIDLSSQVSGGRYGPSINKSITDNTQSEVAQNELKKTREEYNNAVKYTISLTDRSSKRFSELETRNKSLEKSLQKLTKGTKEYNDILKELELNKIEQQGISSSDLDKENVSNGGNGLNLGNTIESKKGNKNNKTDLQKLKKHNEELEKEIENNGKKIYQLVQDNEDAKVSIMKDGYGKDLKELQRTNEKKIQALQSQLHSEEKLQAFRDLIAKTEKEAHEAESRKDKEKASLLRKRIGLMASVYQQMLVENKEIQDNLVTSWEIYNTKLSTITEKGVNDRINKIQKEFEERQKNDKSNFAFEISQLTTLEKAKEKIKQYFSDQVSIQEISRLKNIHQAKKVLQQEFNKKEIEDQKAYLEDLVRELNYMLNSSEWQGMDLTVLTEEQKEEQVKKIAELKEKIAELQALIRNTEEDKKPTGDGLLSSLGGSKDILGMSPEQWEKLFAQTDNLYDKLAKVIAVAQIMQNVFSSYYDLVTANEQAQLQNYEAHVNRKKEALQQQLDQGYINQAEYDRKVTKLQQELDKRKALAEYRAAKRKKQMDIASVITNTSLAIMNALATSKSFIVGLAMAAVASAMGAMQIATISKQPLPDISGYESGYYGSGKIKVRRKQDGKMYDATFGGESRSGLVDNPTVFLAGEGGKNFPEMIIDGSTLTRMRPDVKDAMYEDIARINGYEKGYYSQSGKENNQVPDSPDSEYYKELLFEMRRSNELLEEIKNQERISVVDSSPYQMDKLETAMKFSRKIRNNSKVIQ